MNIVKLKNDRMTVEHLIEQGFVVNANPIEYQGKDLDGFVPNEDRTVWTKQSYEEEDNILNLPEEDEHTHVTAIEWTYGEQVVVFPEEYTRMGSPEGWKRVINKDAKEIVYANSERFVDPDGEHNHDWVLFEETDVRFVPGNNLSCTPEEYAELPDERPMVAPLIEAEYWQIGHEGEHLNYNPLPEPRVSMHLNEDIWNNDAIENPDGNRPMGYVNGYVMEVSGEANSFQHRDLIGNQPVDPMFGVVFEINPNYITGTRVLFGGETSDLVDYVIDGPGSTKIMNIVFRTIDENPQHVVKFSYADGVSETLLVNFLGTPEEPTIIPVGAIAGSNVNHTDPTYGDPVEQDVPIKSDFTHFYLIDGSDGYTLTSGMKNTPDENEEGGWVWLDAPVYKNISAYPEYTVNERPDYWPAWAYYNPSKWRIDTELVNEFEEPVPFEQVWDELTPFEDCVKTPEEFCQWYDEEFRGKYVLAINETWLARMDMSVASYIYMSQNPDEICMPLEDHPNLWCLPMVNFQSFIDTEVTSRIAENLRAKYSNLNNMTTPEDIDVNAVKVFRRWLAEILLGNLESLEGFDDKDRMSNMLNYYANNLYDATVRSLSEMSTYMIEKPLVMSGTGKPLNITLQSGCGCNGGVSAFDPSGVSVICDPVQMYRNAMYNYMVKLFSDIKYWEAQPEICMEMKQYIDAIIRLGLVLKSSIVDPYADCTCGSVDGDTNKNHRVMLQNLSTALDYIINDKVDGNRNFISQAFTQWATYLYEYMYWM